MIALRSAFQWITISVVLLIIAPPFLLLNLFDRGGIKTYWIQAAYLKFCLSVIGMRLKVLGSENVPSSGAFIVMPNHRSYWDIPAIVLGLYPRQVRFVAKKELGNIPVFGWGVRSSGHIMIDRKDRESAVRTLRNVARRFSGGFSIVIFPEGTRSPGRHLLKFKRGGFHLARELDLKIIPVSISGSQNVMSRHTFLIRSGEVTIHFHAPLDPASYPDVDQRVAAVRERIAGGLLDHEPQPSSIEASPQDAGAERDRAS
jgi:1-acyl-sn-glycerol-3-phosphate acyltransferase